jgi:hypothetical protein
MKYVIIKELGVEVPIMFPDIVPHNTFVDKEPISAGKFKIEIDTTNSTESKNKDSLTYFTYGESTSLKLKSRPEDASIIQHAFEFEG